MNSDFAMSHGDLLRTAVRAASLRALTHSARRARSSSASQRKYFCFAAASTITHPYIAGTSFNVNSAPHDLLEGSALKNVDRGNIHKWVSTYKRDYVPKDVKEAFNAKAVGLRSEQAVFVG